MSPGEIFSPASQAWHYVRTVIQSSVLIADCESYTFYILSLPGYFLMFPDPTSNFQAISAVPVFDLNSE